jgi:hypothetical protein
MPMNYYTYIYPQSEILVNFDVVFRGEGVEIAKK